jgi:hypothetical protein
MLAGLGGLRTGTSMDELAAGVRQGQATVWLPLPENLHAADIPASWDITSDSLAAWLAGQLNAAHLLLVKSAALAHPDTACKQLIFDGIIDVTFERFSRNTCFQSWLCECAGHPPLENALQAPSQHFMRIAYD